MQPKYNLHKKGIGTSMEKPIKKELLMDATMRIVVQGGLVAFFMRQVTKAIDVSEALIYQQL